MFISLVKQRNGQCTQAMLELQPVKSSSEPTWCKICWMEFNLNSSATQHHSKQINERKKGKKEKATVSFWPFDSKQHAARPWCNSRKQAGHHIVVFLPIKETGPLLHCTPLISLRCLSKEIDKDEWRKRYEIVYRGEKRRLKERNCTTKYFLNQLLNLPQVGGWDSCTERNNLFI